MKVNALRIAMISLITLQVAAQIKNLSFHGLAWAPNANITFFQATLIVPPGSPAPHTPGDVQAIWPGIQTTEDGDLLQNVVANQGSISQWWHLPFHCCVQPSANGSVPPEDLQTPIQVYPGDNLTSILAYDPANNQVADIWFVSPGSEGTKAGATPWSKTLSYDMVKNESPNPFNMAVLTIELQQNSTWDFGPVTWQNVIIEAATNETDWCKYSVTYGSTGFNGTYSSPMITANHGSSMCMWDTIVFQNSTSVFFNGQLGM